MGSIYSSSSIGYLNSSCHLLWWSYINAGRTPLGVHPVFWSLPLDFCLVFSPVEFGFNHCMVFFHTAFNSLHGLVTFSHLGCLSESRLEGWLSIPNRANIKRYGWKKQVCCTYVAFICILLQFKLCNFEGNISLAFIVFSVFAVCGGKQ